MNLIDYIVIAATAIAVMTLIDMAIAMVKINKD